MTFLIVALWSIIGMVTGAVILGELGPLFGFRNMEGSSAYFGVFTGAPLGLICGAVFGTRMSKGLRRGHRKAETVFPRHASRHRGADRERIHFRDDPHQRLYRH